MKTTPEAFAETFTKPTDDYLRVATTAPEVAIADVSANVTAITEAYRAAQAEQAEVVLTPELSITGYSTADLFHNQHVLEQTTLGLTKLAGETADGPALFVGAPLAHNGVLYNCAVMLAEGKVAGVVPKTRLANYKEFYEKRWFASGRQVQNKVMEIGDQEVPFGTDILFDVNGTKVGVEICEDLFASNSPGTAAALAGAELIVNLSASNELIGKPDYRRTLIRAFTGRTISAYAYASAGRGESVSDVVYGAHQIIAENGRIADQRKPFDNNHAPLIHDIDRTYLAHDRMVNGTWADEASEAQAERDYRVVHIKTAKPADNKLARRVSAHPYVPSNPETLNERCEEIFASLSYGLAQRVNDAHAEALVLGLSGGLDSTLALLIATESSERLGKDADFIHTITMPGPASSERTQDNASILAEAINTTHSVRPIPELTTAALKAIDHDLITEDIPYENTQARLRTLILMNYANKVGGFVQGTGDMSEAMIGWCTFNGDHMSMFNPNAGIPKTLVRHLVNWYAENRATPEVHAVLKDILDTPISPELTGNGDLSQTTEDIVGPYELTDFFIHELLRYGSRPAKIGYLACQAYGETYDDTTVAFRLQQFLGRATTSQWKRNAAPDGLKIGPESPSQRGDLRQAPNTSIDWYQLGLAA